MISPIIGKSQSNSNPSRDLKNGTFSYYPRKLNNHFVTKRNCNFQIETNEKTGDTLLMKINWINNYNYTLRYISSSGKTAKAIPPFIKKHTLAFHVVKVTYDYYIYKSFIEKISKHPLQTDTLWWNAKRIMSNSMTKQIAAAN